MSIAIWLLGSFSLLNFDEFAELRISGLPFTSFSMQSTVFEIMIKVAEMMSKAHNN